MTEKDKQILDLRTALSDCIEELCTRCNDSIYGMNVKNHCDNCRWKSFKL